MKINDLYDVLLGDGFTKQIEGLEIELENLLENEEFMWRQRACDGWLKAEGSNTSFFSWKGKCKT